MNIVFFSDTFLPQTNGVVTYVIEAGLQLKKLGHRILFVVPKEIKKSQIPDGFSPKDFCFAPSIPADVFYPNWRIALSYSYGIDRAIAKFKPDILHIHIPLTISMGGILAAKRFNKPLVGTYHTFISSEEMFKMIGITKGKGTRVLKKLSWEYSNLFYNRCDIVLAPTEKIASILKKNGIKKSITILREGINFHAMKILTNDEKKIFKKKYQLENKKIILYVGRLSREKNLPLLLQVLALIHKKHSNIHLLIVGDGPQKKELMKTAEKLGIENAVTFTGTIPRKKILSDGIYSACDLFLTASKFETFGLTVLEAMGSGLPIITVESQGASELIEGNGYICKDDKHNIAKHVIKILSNLKLQKKFSEQSLKICKKYDSKKTTQKLIQIYKKLIS